MKDKSLYILAGSVFLVLIVAIILLTSVDKAENHFNEPTEIVIGDYVLTDSIRVYLHPDSYDIDMTSLVLTKGTPLFIPDGHDKPSCYDSELVALANIEDKTFCLLKFEYKGRTYEGYVPEQNFAPHFGN